MSEDRKRFRVVPRWLLVAAGGLLVALIGFVFVILPWLGDHDKFNCLHTDIDIQSGRIRRQRFLFFVLANEEVCETGFSELVRKHVGATGPAVWKRDTTNYFLARAYPHYRYHGAAHDCLSMAETLHLLQLPQSREREYVKQSLSYLRSGQLDKISHLASKAFDEYESSQPGK